MLKLVISGGQDGVDIAALKAAKDTPGLQTCGFMTRGYMTVSGPKEEYAKLYGMVELDTDSYPVRTKMNVDVADGTLFIGKVSPGFQATRRAVEQARKAGRPEYPFRHLTPDLLREPFSEMTLSHVAEWIWENAIQTLNVAGNRDASEKATEAWLRDLFDLVLGITKKTTDTNDEPNR